jgi:sensor c-di-GMP phosphodiesterase-like protein
MRWPLYIRRLKTAFVRHLNTIAIVMSCGVFLGGPLSIICGALVLISDKETYIDGQANTEIRLSNHRTDVILQVFQIMDRVAAPACSAAYLQQARSIILSSDFIQDVIDEDHGKLQCSGVMSNQTLNIPGLYKKGFSYSKNMTIWRNLTLPYVPHTEFSGVRQNHTVLIIRPALYPTTLGYSYVLLSHFLVNRQSGESETAQGPAITAPIIQLHAGSHFWWHGAYISIACASDRSNCIAVMARGSAIIRANLFPFGILAIGGALLGSVASAAFIVWRYRQRSLIVRLRRALRRRQLSLVYQAVYDAASGKIVAAEALMRWSIGKGASIGPDQFIPAAEEGGLVGELTRFALETVGRDFQGMLKAKPEFRISVNIVSDDLDDPLFHEALATHIQARGISPTQIALELTERRAAQVEAAAVILESLRKIGYKIFLDDFGTGYSSISYLSSLSIDAIKLDRSFTNTVDSGSTRARLVPPILEMAKEVGVPVIVEGVETDSQARFFISHQVTLMQGWLFGHPVSGRELIAAVHD